MCAVLVGLVAWGALAIALLIAELEGGVTLVPFLVLAGTFEINFFIHTGVERIGRYLQVFYEERAGAIGWETTAMSYGAKFPSRTRSAVLDRLRRRDDAELLQLARCRRAPARLDRAFAPRASRLRLQNRLCKKTRGAQRALDLDRFRSLLSK